MTEPSFKDSDLVSPLLSDDNTAATEEGGDNTTADAAIHSSEASRLSRRSSLSSALLDKAYNHAVALATTRGYSDAIDDAFDSLDTDKTGQLERVEIQAFIQAAATNTKLDVQVGEEVIEAAVDALIHDAGGSDDDYITRRQFHDIFNRHPDMLCCFEDADASIRRRDSARKLIMDDEGVVDDDDEQVWFNSIAARWKNKWSMMLWMIIYVAVNVYLFFEWANLYYHREEAMTLYGNCIVVARGSAHALNFNAFLALIMVCKHFITGLRKTPLRFIMPFDSLHQLHIVVGVVFFLLANVHALAHICNAHRFAKADREEIYDVFEEKLNPPDDYSGRWLYMLFHTRPGITGIIMLVCLYVAYLFVVNRQKHFNRFWYSHHLLLVMLIAMVVHGTQNLLQHFQTLYWLIGPLVLYFLPRFWRETPLSRLKVEKVDIKKGDVVQLRLEKPKLFQHFVSAGMYGLINVPQISRLEWHPFTLTSSPADEYIEFHFRKAGTWTKNVHDLLESKADEKEATGIKDAPVVKVEGPVGASSQGFADYPVVVLVGAGIGITPMISVLKQLLAHPGKVKRCFFYWSARTHDSFEWFQDVMDSIFESDKTNMLQIRYFLTSVKYDDRDLGAVLLHHATRAHHKRTNVDLILGKQVHHQIDCGRPDWSEELESVREECEFIGESDCGIFFCGPNAMAKTVYDASLDISAKHRSFHMYFTKETF